MSKPGTTICGIALDRVVVWYVVLTTTSAIGQGCLPQQSSTTSRVCLRNAVRLLADAGRSWHRASLLRRKNCVDASSQEPPRKDARDHYTKSADWVGRVAQWECHHCLRAGQHLVCSALRQSDPEDYPAVAWLLVGCICWRRQAGYQ